MNSLPFFSQVPFVSTVRHVLPAVKQCLAEKLFFRPSGSREIKHSIGKQLMGCVMECGADHEEKNREATSKSKTNARLVRGQGKVSSRWGWRRRKGCKCTDSNPHLHF